MDGAKIRIKYLNNAIDHVAEIPEGDWIDLRCAEDVTLKQGEFHEVKLGVAMELPKGYEAWLTSRSSMNKKFGIVHCDDLGIIDGSYCGDNDEWKLPVIATRDTELHVNDRICQFRIHKTMREECGQVEFDTVITLGNPDRGGLGSTGTK